MIIPIIQPVLILKRLFPYLIRNIFTVLFHRMHMSKTDIKFHDNYTVQFRQPEMFLFDRDASVGPETDTVTTLNIMFYVREQYF